MTVYKMYYAHSKVGIIVEDVRLSFTDWMTYYLGDLNKTEVRWGELDDKNNDVEEEE